MNQFWTHGIHGTGIFTYILICNKNQPSASRYAIHGSYGARSPCFSTVFCCWHRSAVDLQCYWCSRESPPKWCNLRQALQNEATHPPLRGFFEAPYISVLGKNPWDFFSPGQHLNFLWFSNLAASDMNINNSKPWDHPWNPPENASWEPLAAKFHGKIKNPTYCRWFRKPVNSPVELGSLSHYLQGFLHPRWLAGCLNHQQYVPKHPKTESKVVIWSWCTPPTIDMEPENDDFQALNLLFQNSVLRFHVNFWGV